METISVREVSVNYKHSKDLPSKFVNSPETAASIIRELLPNNSQEHFIALYLNGAHTVIGYSVVFTGTANACTVHPREVFQNAVALGAVALIVGHNHPSGNCEPSEADNAVTTRLKAGGDLLGIKLLDHTIVTDDKHYSYQENFKLI